MSTTEDRARFQYASIMRQTSEGPNHDKNEVIGMHGKRPEVDLVKQFDGGSVVGVRYERLELIEFDERMSDEDIHEYFVEEDVLDKFCDDDGYYIDEAER